MLKFKCFFVFVFSVLFVGSLVGVAFSRLTTVTWRILPWSCLMTILVFGVLEDMAAEALVLQSCRQLHPFRMAHPVFL